MKKLPDYRQPIIGYSRGVPIFQMIGAEEVPDPSGQSATSTASTTDAGQSAGTDAPKAEPKADVVAREEFERLRNQLSAADQKRQEAEQRAKQLEDKDKSELERVTGKAQELEQSVQSLQSELQRARFENAFLRDSSYIWHDPSDVLRFVTDDDSVTIDDKGNVVGMQQALKKLADTKPYLVKPQNSQTPNTPSGDPSNGGSNKGKGPDEETLRRKYAALRR